MRPAAAASEAIDAHGDVRRPIPDTWRQNQRHRFAALLFQRFGDPGHDDVPDRERLAFGHLDRNDRSALLHFCRPDRDVRTKKSL